jgi:hypothetical protein
MLKQSLAALTLLAVTGTAHALTYNETTDTGHLKGTASNVGPGIDTITGFLNSGDVDVFRLELPAGEFIATVTEGDFNAAMVLFDAEGFGLRADDNSGGGSFPKITETLTAGTYYLAIFSIDDYLTPVSESGLIWVGIMFDENSQPDYDGKNKPWNGWYSNGTWGGSSSYTIELNRATIDLSTVPEPGTLALFGLGLGAFGLLRRRA